MNNFPSVLKPGYDKEKLKFEQQLQYWRKYIYESMLNDSFTIPNNCGINLQGICTGSITTNEYQIDTKILSHISDELKNLGWDTTSSYGNSILFVYPKGIKPTELIECSSFE